MRQTYKLKQLKKIVGQVRKWKDHMAGYSDEALAGLTPIFKKRLADGESLDELLPEAFAAICEADRRILGKFPYDTQVLGGIALHKGLLAQMNTGEGKTLVATMPLYLNALTGKSTILVTTNEYLALRDAEEMGQVYRFMGLTVAAGVAADSEKQFSNDEKREIYAADIVYTTNSVLGFDYLFHNLVKSAKERFLRDFYYVIIDEADSVLLDSAQMPLVISGAPRVQSNLYGLADFFVSTLKEDIDYKKDELCVWLTKEGICKAETFFGITNFYSREHFEINRHVALALRAHTLFRREKEYVISAKGELVLLDSGSGRVMPGVKLRGGQHQAIETKEGKKPSQEKRSVASVTYQNLFQMFPKVAGMSGTIADAAQELGEVYGLRVLIIPPNCPVKRTDFRDRYFRYAEDQFQAALDEALVIHRLGQPILIVASTIAETELISQMLVRERVPHNVLNANNAFWEAEMIREAGQKNAVTVATSMAGRGTDIKLGEGVKELGGLAVIGIGRMANVRMERQARGRSGRQGDPGFSRFYVSLEDEIVKRGVDNRILKSNKKLSEKRLKRLIQAAQKLSEETATASRKQAYEYDLVLQRQREMVYSMRDCLLDGGAVGKVRILEIARTVIDDFLKEHKKPGATELTGFLLDNISYTLTEAPERISRYGKREIRAFLVRQVESGLRRQEKQLKSPEKFQEFVRYAVLQAIDDAWVEEVDYLQQLQSAVRGRSTAQRNPIYEYQVEAQHSYDCMKKNIYRDIVRYILLSTVTWDERDEPDILLP